MCVYFRTTNEELMLSALVPFQITRCSKTLLAHITFVRFLVRVNTHVSFQTTRCSKTLLAHIAFVRLLVRVNTHVVFQSRERESTVSLSCEYACAFSNY